MRNSDRPRAFLRAWGVGLAELLVAPVVFHASTPALASLPAPSAAVMADLARWAGHSDGAVRTALSRLRAVGELAPEVGADGVTRYRGALDHAAIERSVRQRLVRPEGYLLAVFSFATDDAPSRRALRDVLIRHGFQRLTDSAYLSGAVDAVEVERAVDRLGLSRHLYLFRCEAADPSLDRRLVRLFRVAARRRRLADFGAALRGFLDPPGDDDDERARRIVAAGPAHYRVTFVEEPPLPSRLLPPDYPLADVSRLLDDATTRRAAALRRWYQRLESPTAADRARGRARSTP